MFVDKFNEQVNNLLEKFSYKFYLIHLDQHINCICIDSTTKNPKPECPICLGTGHKIYIRQIEGTYQNTDIPAQAASRGSDSITIARNYYINSKYKINQNDLIVDGNDVFFVFISKVEKSFNNKTVYTKNTTYAKKFNQIVFMKNFRKIIGE